MADNALIKAARAGDRDKCVRLLDGKRTGDVSKRGAGKKTAVMTAAEGGHLDIAELLIEHGASLLDKDKDKTTLVMIASKGGNMKLVELLLSKGANFYDRHLGLKMLLTSFFLDKAELECSFYQKRGKIFPFLLRKRIIKNDM